jgi:hypothetical protein
VVNTVGSAHHRLRHQGPRRRLVAGRSLDRVRDEPHEVENQPADIDIVKPDGSRLTNLTHNSGSTEGGFSGSADPVWSLDGTRIMFLDGRFTADSDESGLATMKPHGKHRTFVPVADGHDEHQIDWESLRTRL